MLSKPSTPSFVTRTVTKGRNKLQSITISSSICWLTSIKTTRYRKKLQKLTPWLIIRFASHGNNGSSLTLIIQLRAILNAMTLLVIVSCIIPIVFAWQLAPDEVGSINDSDIWLALQTLLMQLLSLFTMMLPVSRFAPEVAWQLAWAFAVVSGLCAIATPVTVPIKWSFLASYAASAAQAAVLLEIMLKSRYASRKIAWSEEM